MRYYQFTIINGVNGWISCQVERYRKFRNSAAMTRYLRGLQRDYSWVSVVPITRHKYLKHTGP